MTSPSLRIGIAVEYRGGIAAQVVKTQLRSSEKRTRLLPGIAVARDRAPEAMHYPGCSWEVNLVEGERESQLAFELAINKREIKAFG